ncbi:MAG: aminopeptidase P family protein [Deltaproteobacteria bacterium]|nr:MAG: aminopeptidase P family protein [Deltaproteobacteria bacterium]
MPKTSIEARIDKLLEKLDGRKVDAAWIVQPENRRYLSGFTAEDSQLTESSGSLIIGGQYRLLLTDTRYAEQAKNEASSFDIVTVKGDLTSEFPKILSKIGCKSLGFEDSYLIWGTYVKLKENIKQQNISVELLPLNNLVEDMRKIKDAEEIDAIKASVRLITSIVKQMPHWLTPGMSEREVAWKIEDHSRRSGAEAMAFPPIVASGPNGALPHAVPTDKEILPGEPIVVDVGVKLNGYCSDTTRTLFVGKPDKFFLDIYKIVREAQIKALETIRPGVSTDLPDKKARAVISEAGYGDYFGHALGHGVGLATHEGPRLSPRDPEPLLPGMVVTVEPGIYIPGKGGVRLEEMVLVTDTGVEILTNDLGFYILE